MHVIRREIRTLHLLRIYYGITRFQISQPPTTCYWLSKKERRVELAFENHRWFDLVRTGRAKDVMTAEQKFDGYSDFTWSDDALAYPIPMTVMQSNPGKIIQNKGYTQL